jgi:hypothetical protein
MKGKKTLFLFLALLLPGCIFVFLKIFGKNQFDVPLLYQEGKIEAPADCGYSYDVPYSIPDSIMKKIESGGRSALYVLNFSGAQAVLNRLMTETQGEDLSFVLASDLFGDANAQRIIKDCILLMKAPADLVLIDTEKRICGYYSSAKLDDVDRLLLETKILLKKY